MKRSRGMEQQDGERSVCGKNSQGKNLGVELRAGSEVKSNGCWELALRLRAVAAGSRLVS